MQDIHTIYPECMTVELSNSSPFIHANYLDLNIYIDNNKFKIGLFDKRRLFNFDILGFPHIMSNIPPYIASNTFLSQIGRFTKICGNNPEDFKHNMQLLILKFTQNGFSKNILFKLFSKFRLKNVHTRVFLNCFWENYDGRSLFTR
jgi:hypothetical protein